MRRSEAGKVQSFLEPHQIETARRVARLFECAHLGQRTTMQYSPMPPAGRNTGVHGEISDMAADARKSLAAIYRILPAECAGVVMDVCCYDKGLQAVEAERGWPRRSAKLVLKIGLEHLAQQFGLSASAKGPQSQSTQNWMDETARPSEFG